MSFHNISGLNEELIGKMVFSGGGVDKGGKKEPKNSTDPSPAAPSGKM